MNSSVFLDMGTKLRPLLRTGFSTFESGRFTVIVLAFERCCPVFARRREVF